MTIKNKNIGDKNRKISGKKIMLVTALLSGGVVIRVNHHINNSFGRIGNEVPKEVINFDLTLESTEVLINDSGVFYVGQGTPIDNFDIYDFVTILDEDGNIIPKSDVTLEWDIKEYFEGNTFGTEGEYYITITATTADGRTGELEYKLVVKEGHIFEEIKEIDEVEIEQTHTTDLINFQEHFRVLNSVTGAETLTDINSTLEDEDLRTLGTKQVIFYTELDGIKFTNSVHISVVDTIAPVIELENSFDDGNGFEWDQRGSTINISDLDKALGDFSLEQYATAYDGSGEYELSWNFEEVMTNKMDKIGTYTVAITAIDSSGNVRTKEIYVNISTVKIEFKDGIGEVAFELYNDAKLEDAKYKVGSFYNVYDAGGNIIADDKISWTLTEEMIRELGTYRVTIEVLDDSGELIGSKGIEVKVQDTLAPIAIINPSVNTIFDIEVNQNMSVDNLFMYLNGLSDIDELVFVTENSGVWGYRFLHRNEEITDDVLRTVGLKTIRVEFYDYDVDGNESNYSYLTDSNGDEINLTFNIQDTTAPVVNVVNDVIDLEVVQSATKDMIEITNYAEINDNSGSFTWELRVKGSQDAVMDYAIMLGKITDPAGVELELVVTDSEGNVTYNDMLLIVSDTTPPVIEVRLSEETININPSASDLAAIRDINKYVRVSDNSLNPIVTWDFDQVVRQATNAGIFYVTVSAIDGAGNVSEETITFTVVDNEAPVIIVNTKTIEIEANEYTNKDELEFDINLNDYITVTDNSNGLIDTTFDYSNVDFSEIGIYDVAITATDASGNESINIIELKVIAGEPKVRVLEDDVIVDTMAIENLAVIGIKVAIQDGKILIERAPTTSHAEIMTHLTIENLFEFLTITGETIESSSLDLSGLDFTVLGSNMVTLNATNNFGKTTAQTFEFVVIQEWDSILELKGDNFIDLEINTNEVRDETWFNTKYDVLDYVKLRGSLATANFAWDDTSITNIDFNNVGSSVITIWLNDGAGVRNEVSLNFNVIDTTAAIISATDSTIIEINDKDASDYDVYNFVTVKDNSDLSTGSTVVLSWNLDTQVDFTKVGTYTVTIKAVDASGNVSTKDITFEVEDKNAPVLTINSGMDTQTIEINSRNESQFNVNSFVTAVDNSGVAPSLEWNIEDVDFTQTGTYTVIVRATDKAGNVSNEVTITFEVVDTIAPTIDIDPSGLEELKTEIATKTETDYSDWLEDYVTVTDNSNEDITPTWDITSVDFKTVGSYMIVISATDSSGHTTTANVVFAVADTTAPTITLKDNMETTEYEVLSQVGTNLNIDDFVTCDDATNCIMSWDMNSVNFDRVGTYVVTIKAVDMYGNESIQEITLEVQDTTKPEIVITRPDILISMNKHTSSDFDINDFATVTDNYDTSVSLTWNIDNVEFDKEGTYTVTVSAIDSNGNEAEEKEVTFKVEEVNIVLREVKDFEIEVSQTVDAGAVVIADYFTATEENGTAVQDIQWNLTDDMLMTYGTHRVTLTIEFDGGKFIDIEVTLEVVDNTDPTVNVDTTTTTIELGDTAEFDNLKPEDFVTVTDNSNDVTYSWDFDNVVEQTVAGTYTVAITVTDVAGNETLVTTEIVVEDTVAPDLVLNDDFDRNNMTWSKSTAELSILASDKAPGEIDLWELVTATDLSTGGLTISWNLADAELNQVGHYTVDIEVSDGTLISTETITVNVLRATPILNDFNVDKSYNEIIVDVDITNINQAISELKIILLDSNGVQITEYDQDLTTPLDALTINHVFNVNSNTEYKVVLEYTYATLANNSDAKTITDTKDVKTLAYSQNDVLGTISDMYISHTEIMVNYEINNDLSLMTNALLVLVDKDGNDITSMNHTIDRTSETGTHTFTTLTSNTEYTVEIRIDYDFNDGTVSPIKIGDSRDVKTLEYTEHDVITDITGVTQSPSTISVDYNITDAYGLIITDGMNVKIYDANDMSTLVESKPLTSLNGTIKFDNLLANTSYIIVIETELDLVQDGVNTSYVMKETGVQTTTESYSFDEITVNINNVIVDYNNITFDYEVFDPSGLLVENSNGNKLQIEISGQIFELTDLIGSVSLEDAKYLSDVNSGTSYDIQIHFDYNLKDGNGDIRHDTNLYGFVESTRAYDLDTDLTLTSHNLASDTSTIYVDYSLRNLNNIGNMSTMAIVISSANDTETILLSDYFSALGITEVPLVGQIMLSAINGVDLTINTPYDISIEIEYDFRDGHTGPQREVLLLETTEIKTQEQALTGYNVISDVTRGYTFLNSTFNIEDTTGISGLLDSFEIALLDKNGNVVPGYDYTSQSVSTTTDNLVKFVNLTSNTDYSIVYRIDDPNNSGEYIDIVRKVSTRTYDTNLIDVDYTLTEGLTYLHLENIVILNNNENSSTEAIDYNRVIAMITYTSRDGQVITIEKDLGALTDGSITSALFTGIQSNTDVKIDFKLEFDLKDGEGIQSGDDEIVRAFDEKTLEYDFTFVIENDEVLVTGLTPGFAGDHLVIFEEVEGYIVKDIKEDAFYGDSISFSQLTIPRSLETIGQNAFRSVALTTVNLTSVFEVIPTVSPRSSTYSTQGILVIGDNGFRDNTITSFDFTTTETIGVSAFRNNNMNDVLLSDSISYVGDEAFVGANVKKLTLGVLLGNNNFGNNTFTGNAINDLTVGNTGFQHDSLGLSSDVLDTAGFKLTFADSAVGKIPDWSWVYDSWRPGYLNAPINELIIGDGIEEIGMTAFTQNSILRNVEIGNSVHTIGINAFGAIGLTSLTLGDSVRVIDDRAFNNNDLSSITFPETLETIGSEAFYKNDILEIELKDKVSMIGNKAFADNGMEKLSIGALLSDSNFGDDTFIGNSINDLTVGNTGFQHDSLGLSSDVLDTAGFKLTFADSAVGKIPDWSWVYDSWRPGYLNAPINELIIGDGIEEIGMTAFTQNSILRNVEIGNSVHTIGINAFGSIGLTSLTLGDGVRKIDDRAFNNNDLTVINFPASLETIGAEAFYRNNILDIELKDNVSAIGDRAFADNGIKKLSIGALLSDSNFGSDTFLDNSINDLTVGNVGFKHDSLGLSSDVLDLNGFKLTFADSAVGDILDWSWTYDSWRPGYLNAPINELIIGDGIETIGMAAFTQNQLLKDVIIGANVHTIKANAFGSLGLTSLTLGERVTAIEEGAFQKNDLTSISLPESIDMIGKNAFLSNELIELVIPKNISTVGEQAFAGNKLEKLTIEGNVSSSVFGLDVFVSKNQTSQNTTGTISELIIGNTDYKYDSFGKSEYIFSPLGLDLTYTEEAKGSVPSNSWRQGASYSDISVVGLTIGTGITSIGNNAFKDNLIAGNVLLDNVTIIGESAFENNELDDITLSTSLESIGDNAFNSNNLVSVSIPDNTKTLGDYSFANNNISTFNFVTNITTISEGLLAGNSLTALTLPEHIENVEAFAFKDNDISSLVLSEKITKFNEGVFENNKLTSFIIESHITDVGERAFAGNTIAELNIPLTIQSIAKEAFADNNTKNGVPGLTKLSIEDGVSATLFSAGDVFVGNEIETLIVGSTDFKHNTFGSSENVFNTTKGLDLEFTDTATGAIIDSAWEFSTDASTSNIKLNGIKIGNSITSIGNKAFFGNILKTVVIGNSVTTLGEQSFASMGITSLTLGDSVTTIGKEAFLDNDITGFMVNGVLSSTVPDAVETIGESAFKNNSIDSLVLPDSVSRVENNAFENNGMTKLSIGSLLSDSNFGSDTFVTNAINHLTINNIGFKHDSLGASQNVFASTGFELVIPNGTMGVIADSAWKYSTESTTSNVKINSVTIGDDITFIGEEAFFGNNLSSVVIGNGVTEIGQRAFSSMKISSLTLGDSLTTIGNEAFLDNDITGFMINGVLSSSVPSVVEIIGHSAFKDNAITELLLPDSVKAIGNNAFEGNGMTKLTTGELLSDGNFGDNTFIGNAINDLTIGNTGFKFDSLGASDSVLDTTGFKLTFADTAVGKILDWSWVYDANRDGYLKAPINELKIGDGVEEIGITAFAQNSLLKDVKIGESVHTIGDNSFGSLGLTSLTLGSSVRTIGTGAFQSNNLTNIDLPSSVTSIGDNAFLNNKINAIDIPTNIDVIGHNAFKGNEITTIDIPNTLTKMGNASFMNNKITSLTIGTGIVAITDDLFNGNAISTLILPSHIQSIGSESFANNEMEVLEITNGNTTFATDSFAVNKISDLTINNPNIIYSNFGTASTVFASTGLNLTYANGTNGAIPNNAWRGGSGYSNLTISKLSLGSGITSINNSAFRNSSLQGEIEFPDSLTTIGYEAFGYNSISSVIMKNNVTSLGDNAFISNQINILKLSDGLNPTNMGTNTFTSNQINDLTIGHSDIGHDTLGLSENVYASTGLNLTYTDAATGMILANSWSTERNTNGNRLAVSIDVLRVGDGVDDIQYLAFYNAGINELYIGNNVKSVDANTFTDNNISKLVIGTGMKNIKGNAFQRNNITEVILPVGIESIEARAFLDNVGLKRVVFLGGSIVADAGAFNSDPIFYGADGVTEIT